jgi:SSS family solute:Na+ symporter
MLDCWIVGIYLLITLVVGVWQGKNIKNFRSFSIADKNYSTVVLVATMSATWLGGGASLGTAEKTFIYGSIFFFVSIGEVFSNLMIAKFIAPRVEKFSNSISIGDMIGNLYGKHAKIISGVAATLFSISVLGAQISGIGYIFQYFLNIPFLVGIVIGVGIVIIYSAFGGMKAVTITDVIQFIVIIVAIPMICNVGLSKIGGYTELFKSIPLTHSLALNKIEDPRKLLNIFLLFCLPSMGPAMILRLLMARNARQASEAFAYTAFIYLPFYFLVCCIGLVSLILQPNLDPVLAMPYLINEALPTGLKGLAISGLLAIIMSTVDSALHAGVVSLVHDIIKPLTTKLKIENELRITQILTVIIGILSIIAAVSFKSVLDIMIFAKLLWHPIVMIGLYAGFFNFKADKRCFLAGIIGAIITITMWSIFSLEKLTSFSPTIPAIIGNGISFFGFHYYYKLYKPKSFDPIDYLSNFSEPIGKKS